MKLIIWDQWGMILQTGDGGDSAANMGTYHIFLETRRRMGQKVFPEGYYANKEKPDFQLALLKLEDPVQKGEGRFRRHPDPSFWGSRANTMSRDQTIPLLGAMALYGLKRDVWKYILGHALRLFLFTTNTTPNWSYPGANTLTAWEKIKFFFGWDPGYVVYANKIPDITFGDFWALELRGIYSPWLWPLLFPILCLLDVITVIGSITKVKSYAIDPSNSDDRNHVNTMLIGLQICPTPVIKLAAKIYATRPRAADTSDLTSSGPQSALNAYYQADNSPPFNVLGRPIIKNFFEGNK